jgi:hypothetical protein
LQAKLCFMGHALMENRNGLVVDGLVWAWADWFYRHRQRRWRALAKCL